MEKKIESGQKVHSTNKKSAGVHGPLKIVLLHPHTTVPPFGLMSIAAMLEKQKIPVKIIAYTRTGMPDERVLSDVEGADIIGISVYTMPMLREAVRITKLLKEKTKAFLFWGGVHATLFPEKSLEEFDLDCVVVNEGEYVVPELIDAISKKKPLYDVKGMYLKKDGKTFFTGQRPHIENLDSIPGYAWHLVDVKDFIYVNLITRRKSILIIESRGCPYDCSFCYVNKMFGRRWRGRSPSYVIKEMCMLNDKFGLTHFDFLDDLPFGGSKKLMLEFCDSLKPLNFTWTCDDRVNCVDLEVLQAMKDAGCRYIYYGVESGSQRILELTRKGTTVPMIENAFKLTAQVGINCMAGFIGGFPGETVEDLRQTVSLAKRIRATKYRLAKYVPYPGGDLYEECIKMGFEPPQRTVDFADIGDYKKGSLNLSKIPEGEFKRAKRQIEYLTFPNSLKFAFRNKEFIFLPYFFLDTLPPWIARPMIAVLRSVTYPIRRIIKQKG